MDWPAQAKKPKTQDKEKDLDSGADPAKGFTFKRTDVFTWAKRICEMIHSKGHTASPFTVVNVYTEFSGSSCAESAVESVVNNILGEKRVQLHFKSMADIKTTCRKVCMATRKILR